MDSGNRRIVRLNSDGQRLGVWTDERFERPHTAVSVGDSLYVTDTTAHCIWRIVGSGNAHLFFGELGGAEGELNGPRGIASTSDGQWVVVDGGNRRIVVHDANGRFVREWSLRDSVSPRHVVIDGTDTIHVSDAPAGRVWAFSTRGELLGEHVPTHAQSTLPTIRVLSLDARGDVVVALRA
ncbi:MAG: DNA-binding beta-propeller fold protein YncE [Bradymonadia bacterium]|jgi:DNA-binding beta-propeller fold protein YncE